MAVFAVLVTAFGLAVGSFLNVCIHRLPLGESLAFPASRCPRCGTPLKPYDNIPIVSYLMLRGRCRACGNPRGCGSYLSASGFDSALSMAAAS